MPSFVNRYSYIWFSAAILVALTALGIAGVLRDWWLLVIPLVLLLQVAGFLLLRSGHSTLGSPAEVRRLIGTKQPVLLEFYSDY
jgi:hypothetical protein